ncbi:FadR family transcriptional regulator [Labedella phragmitis]|uniref:FadR family transcriptional regulator n=1 Tax=Labedella phragmitis TaxID=2498849 RepID=A0A444PZ43_9MICO|nr:GntR family transcriptional regulator [Labedella phragmitis]RWZ53107.1 FadR family transcriptional regulator [Labedella phragmitis]
MPPTRRPRSESVPRAETIAERIAERAREAGPRARLGSRQELREAYGVSIGTLHEALRLLQSTGEISVRTGPGGGVFAGESSALSDLVRSLHPLNIDGPLYPQTARVLEALRPLVFADAVDGMTAAGAMSLRQRVTALTAARDGDLQTFVRSSLEVFATIVSIPPAGILTAVAGSILRTQMDTLRHLSGPIDPQWRADVDRHHDAVSDMVGALIERDADGALGRASDPAFMGLFAAVAARATP